jgi:hypothetical protein
MPDSLWILICASLATAAYFVGRHDGYENGYADRQYEAMVAIALERLRRGVFGEGEDG